MGKEEPEGLTETPVIDGAGLTPALKETKGEPSKQTASLPDTERGRQDPSGGTNLDRNRPFPPSKPGSVYLLALLLALLLFSFHVVVILDVVGELFGHEAWLLAHLSRLAGEAALLGCFFVLFAAHFIEAAAWGLFLRWTRLFPSTLEGIYFAATSATTLGYGDVVLPRPWRQLGPLIAIHGVLLFGCSTAFLFVILQHVWAQQL
ncbi:two pore domain potassium channel family protein [Thiorhodococcus mannitoliphagus]|uniref:Two pore domain potassium channel family protein n=2 Tax=Thiorhodococcus mannitoliphagus TaxID=329406 RepID=A0A6P1DZ17_9GAMM|nr:two pore domain potassium channel family protein [Thiorhodococcus mannitoliphagus]